MKFYYFYYVIFKPLIYIFFINKDKNNPIMEKIRNTENAYLASAHRYI